MRLLLVIAAAAWFGVTTAAAELVWEHDARTFNTEIGQRLVETTFPFRNEGERSITISGITSSCGCTVPALDQKTYAPGEGGEIEAVFNIGSRVGRHSSRIIVRTDDDAVHVLTMTLHIPEVVRLEPTIMSWAINEPAEPQTLTITAGTERPVYVESVTSTDPLVRADLETEEEGRAYRVTVTPETTEETLFATLRVDASAPDGVNETYYAHARVIRAPVAATARSHVQDASEQPAPTAETPAAEESGAPMVVTPRILAWRADEGSTPKQMTIEVNTPEPVDITGVEGSNDAFLFLFETVEEGRVYRVTVTPRNTSEPARTALRFVGAPSDAPAALARVAGEAGS